MKSPCFLFSGLALIGVAGLHAETVVQTVNFSESATYTAVNGPVQLVDSSFFTGVFDPFDDALGTLDSFVIEWTLANTATGNLGGAGGSVSLTVTGSFTLNGDIYRGGVVGADGGGGPPNGPIALSAPIAEIDTFLVSGAGADYDADLLAAVSGEDTFIIGFSAPVDFSVSGSATFDASTVGDVKLTYNYSAVPEPAGVAGLAGLGALAFAACHRRRRAG